MDGADSTVPGPPGPAGATGPQELRRPCPDLLARKGRKGFREATVPTVLIRPCRPARHPGCAWANRKSTGATGADSTVPGPAGADGAAGAAGVDGFTALFHGGFSQPSGSLWLPTNAILENFSRYAVGPITNQATTLTSGTIRVFPLGILRAGHTGTGLGFIPSGTASAITNSWAGISDSARNVLAISPTSTAATTAGTSRIHTFSTPYTASADIFLLGFIMYAATTVPGMFGMAHTNTGVTGNPGPVATGTANTAQTTPPALPFTLNALTAATQVCYLWLTGTT